jgi:hypothetical protein
MPEDAALARKISDLESGRALRRRRRRRILFWGGLSCAAAGLALWAFGAELACSHRLVQVLRAEVDDPLGIDTLPALRAIADEQPWLPSGREAHRTAQARAEAMLAKAAVLRLDRQNHAARLCLAAALPSLPEALRQRADVLSRQLRREAPLAVWLQRAEHSGTDDGEACEALARASEPEFLEFHLAMLPGARTEAARRSMLRALQVLDDPRSALPVARALFSTADASVTRMALDLLGSAARREPEQTRTVLADVLAAARTHPETRARADQVLELLSQHAAPGGK